MIIPGYVIGLCCLFLITYRTLIAFFSKSNAVTIYINKFGEQYIDILALIIFWIICLVGLIILFKILREENINKDFRNKLDKEPIIKQDNSFFDIDNIVDVKIGNTDTLRFLVESSDDIDQDFNNYKS